ncbi:hypothetical protein GCM10025865_06740 [Paraoerskovia sediminicola]|uniref:Cupin type-2 domain-containing protein n=1 Tax=Paraoerskovia sediminicola TaxID=1138587 RepID=A0ABM8FZW7_9CELL|nr:cupin domain-containing protein [Paraoerskovia sediminicola]BDZ41375.1 hypothetical protein GCM10025865_06740 [Paraoerskovia sediminicola]
MSDPLLPGGSSASLLSVYDWPAPDAPGGSGSPHLHTVASEAYVVVAGEGAVQTLSAEGFAERDLVPGRVVWFTAGVVHRLLNRGGLEIVVLMSDSGLPEAGDAVLTFPPDVLADPEAYRAAVTLPAPGSVPDDVRERAARRRRDLALEGYRALLSSVEDDGPGALGPLHEAAARLVAPQTASWARSPAGVEAGSGARPPWRRSRPVGASRPHTWRPARSPSGTPCRAVASACAACCAGSTSLRAAATDGLGRDSTRPHDHR